MPCRFDARLVRHGLNSQTAPAPSDHYVPLEIEHMCPSGAFRNAMLCPQGTYASFTSACAVISFLHLISGAAKDIDIRTKDFDVFAAGLGRHPKEVHSASPRHGSWSKKASIMGI